MAIGGGGVLLLAGVGIGVGYAATATSTAPASDESAVTAPTSEAEPTPEVEAPVEQSPAATVDDVTTPKSQPKTGQAPTEQAMTVAPGVTPLDPNDLARGGRDANGNYVPALPVQKPGDPPAEPYTPVQNVPKMPGEPGYTD